MGVRKFLAVAIHEHQNKHHGALPKAICLHPENYASLSIELTPADNYFGTDGVHRFMSIPIRVTRYITEPYLVTATDEVEAL